MPHSDGERKSPGKNLMAKALASDKGLVAVAVERLSPVADKRIGRSLGLPGSLRQRG